MLFFYFFVVTTVEPSHEAISAYWTGWFLPTIHPTVYFSVLLKCPCQWPLLHLHYSPINSAPGWAGHGRDQVLNLVIQYM